MQVRGPEVPWARSRDGGTGQGRTVNVQGTGSASGPIVGEPDFTSFGGVATGNGTNISTTWPTWPANGLPSPFSSGAVTYGAAAILTVTPNIYVGP